MTQVTLLDGSIGQELVKRADGPPTPLWSTQSLIDRPGLVAEVHADYAAAGATVATTNTYAIHRDRLRGGSSNHYAGDDVELPDREHLFAELLNRAVAETRDVRGKGRVAGSIGPLGASYRTDIHPDEETATPIYAEVVSHLAPDVDLLLFETISSLKAARACVAAGRQSDLPVWLSFSVDDSDGTRLRSGEAVADAVALAAQADAVLVNCSVPEVIGDALAILAQAGVPMGAYANGFTQITQAFIDGGTTVSDLSARTDLTPAAYADHALAWVDQGATIIGGCCEVGPAHIAEIATRLRAVGHTIV